MPRRRDSRSSAGGFQIAAFLSVTFSTFVMLLTADGYGQQTGNPPSGSWTFFRGNKLDGHSSETGIADIWSERGPAVLWHRDLGVGYSGLVGDSGRVYTQYQSLTGQYVACLDAKTGATIWETKYAWPYQPASLYPGPRSTPTICGQSVFVTAPNADLFCFDAKMGAKIWEVNLAEKFAAPDVEFGYACSPVCRDGKVFLPVGGKDASMVAFNQSDGAVIWSSGNDPISYCSAYPIEFENRSIIVGYFKNSLRLFDQQTGEELGSVSISVGYDEHSAWPIFSAPYLWVSGPFRTGSRLYKLEIESAGSSKIRLRPVYVTKTMSNDVASSVLVGEHLYGFDLRDVQSKVHRPSRGRFTCSDFLTGKICWQNGAIRRRKLQRKSHAIEETVASGWGASDSDSDTDIGHASVIVADDKLIMLNDTGELILGRVDSQSFQQLARTTILGGEICWTQPILMDRCLFVRNHSKAVCVYLGDVETLEKQTNQVQFASDVPQATYVDWASLVLGTEPTYAMTAPKPSWLVRWFLISVVLGWLIAPAVGLGLGYVFRGLNVRAVFLTVAFVGGLLGTTVAGHWLGVFYFSWPICLAVLLEVLVCQIQSADTSIKTRPVFARLMLVSFLVACVGFFLLCRRLSLPFEWTFLLGFPAALPFVWVVKRKVQGGRRFEISQWAWSLLGFIGFYWMGAGIMIWKYAV